VQPLGVREPDDFDEAFASMVRDPPDALLMVSDELTFLNRRRVYEFAAEHRLPATYERANYVRDGGLSSLSPDLDEIYDRATDLVDRILKGAKPADLPFEQPTRFHVSINLKTEGVRHNRARLSGCSRRRGDRIGEILLHLLTAVVGP
jgi:putative ABC transport system substrate-binding protein